MIPHLLIVPNVQSGSYTSIGTCVAWSRLLVLKLGLREASRINPRQAEAQVNWQSALGTGSGNATFFAMHNGHEQL